MVVQDHVSKETVEALFDAMGGLITDASLDVFKRRMGEIVGEDRDAVKDRLVRAYMGGWIDRSSTARVPLTHVELAEAGDEEVGEGEAPVGQRCDGAVRGLEKEAVHRLMLWVLG